MRREPDHLLVDTERVRKEAGDETARAIAAIAQRVEVGLDDRGRIRNNFEVAMARVAKLHVGSFENYLPGPGALSARSAAMSIADDNAVRLEDVPDPGFCLFVGGDVNQAAFFHYDLGSSTTNFGGTIGGTISLDGNNARTGTDGADTTINIGASSAGFDIENRAGGPISVVVFLFGHK